MNMSNQNCSCDVSTYALIKFEDKCSSKLIVENDLSCKFSIIKYTIDGCVISSGKRCDYKLYVSNHPCYKEYYIELKGRNYIYALEQIKSTMDILGVNCREPKIGIVVLSNPTEVGSEVAKRQRAKLKTYYNMTIKQKTTTGRKKTPVKYDLKYNKFID